MSLFHLQAVAEISAARIVDSLLEGAIIALLAGAALRVRRQSSGIRFAVWFSALVGIAVLPVLNSLHSAVGAGSSAAHSAITLPSSWAFYFFAAWALIAAVSLARVGVSLWHLRALRKSCVAVEGVRLDAAMRETLSAGNARRVSLCVSGQVQVPTAIGFFKPAVVIPAWLLDDLSGEELNQIVLHELAHLRRRDDWTNLIQKIVKALFFFHPAVWWIEKRLSLEREMACDDAVLAATAQPRAYAECLAHLAERIFVRGALVRRGIALAQAALGRVRHTSLRVAQILNPNRPRAAKQSWKTALSLMAVFVIGSVMLAPKEPRLIAFEDAGSRGATGGRRASLDRADEGVRPSMRTGSAGIRHAAIPPVVASKTRARFPHKAAPSEIAAAAPLPSEVANSPAGANLIHFATFTDATTETFFLLVQTTDSGSSIPGRPMCQIQMWRVTVFHPAPAAAKPIPNKET
jgi:beta-lactamase regulating signal transducer with metallopeptidase domain